VNSAEHIAEAEKLLAAAEQAMRVQRREDASLYASLATAHAAVATAIEAQWTREARGGR